MILSLKLYNIVNHDTGIKGYWQDKEGKVYIDNIDIISYPVIYADAMYHKIYSLFNEGEKAVFYRDIKDKGIIIYPNLKKDILPYRITWNEKHITKGYIKELLNNNGGCTIYKNESDYTVEIYKG